jgi:hypothetical protein
LASGNLFWYGLALSEKDISFIVEKGDSFFYNRYPKLEYLA